MRVGQLLSEGCRDLVLVNCVILSMCEIYYGRVNSN